VTPLHAGRSRAATRRARWRTRPSPTSARSRLARARATERERADEGFAMSSPVAMMGAAAVLLAGVAFLFTGGDDPTPEELALASGPAHVEPAVTLEAVRVRPTVQRGETYVSVFNNSNITGLASSTATRISGAGWQVVGSDNWFGTIPATTVYYPPQLEAAARLLGKDLGVERVLPAVDPMSMDRLTVILTSDFA